MINCCNCEKSFSSKKHMKRHAKKCSFPPHVCEEITPQDKIQEIMEKVFIGVQYYACCLPAAMMFYEQIERFGIHSEVKKGFIMCEVPIPIHFWNEIYGKVYDPSLAVARDEHPDIVVNYHEGYCIITNLEDKLMEVAYDMFQSTKSTEFFFSMAPEEILKIRRKIHDQVTPFLNTYNKNRITCT